MRIGAARAGVRIFEHHAPWGIGSGGYPLYGTVHTAPHSLAVQLLAENGVIGALSVVFLLVFLLMRALRLIAARGSRPDGLMVQLGCAVGALRAPRGGHRRRRSVERGPGRNLGPPALAAGRSASRSSADGGRTCRSVEALQSSAGRWSLPWRWAQCVPRSEDPGRSDSAGYHLNLLLEPRLGQTNDWYDAGVAGHSGGAQVLRIATGPDRFRSSPVHSPSLQAAATPQLSGLAPRVSAPPHWP